MKEKITQTAGREQLGEFAPLFARLGLTMMCFSGRFGMREQPILKQSA